MFLPSLLGGVSAYAGVWVLVTPAQTFRLGGLLALLGSIPVLWLIVAYVRRPVMPPPAP